MIILSYLLIWSLNSQFEICCTYCCNMLLLQIGPLCGWIRLFFLPPSFVYNNSSLQFYQFLSERLRVRRLIFPVYRHANQFPLVHRFPGLISVTLRSTSLVRLLFFPSLRLYLPFSLLALFSLHLSLSSSASVCLSLSLYLHLSFFLAVDFCERDGGGVKRTRIAAVCTRVCVSWLGHGSLYQRVRFRVSPRVPGKPRTCHPSAETGRRRRSTRAAAVLPLSLRCASPFTRQQPCRLLHLAGSFSSNDTVLPLRFPLVLINYDITKYIHLLNSVLQADTVSLQLY